jgi:U3 small nucleolar RNA-associated protein 10
MSLAAQLRVLSGHAKSTTSSSSGSRVGGIGGLGNGSAITPSFLFSSKQAADTDTSSIHLLALSALTELRSLDERFSAFEVTIFGSEPGTMSAFSRSSQSSSVVEALDRSIGSFLRVLSPYFTMAAAHKCIEWLIRRYEAHLYNVEALLEMSLPYHDSPLFARLLQLLRIDSSVASGRWLWLGTAQKNNASLARTTLAARCAVVSQHISFIYLSISISIAINQLCLL